MATQIQAQSIYDYVLAFFKGCTKTTNIVYRENNSKTFERYVAALTAQKHIVAMRSACAAGSIGDLGEMVAAQQGTTRSGNCHEMASMCVALATRIPDFGPAWVCVIGAPGDHSFCVVGRPGIAKPEWPDVRRMLGEERDFWVIDPWAKICCRPKQYEASFMQRMTAWHRDGRLITANRIEPYLKDKSGGPIKTFANIDPLTGWYTAGFLNGQIRMRAPDHAPHWS